MTTSATESPGPAASSQDTAQNSSEPSPATAQRRGSPLPVAIFGISSLLLLMAMALGGWMLFARGGTKSDASAAAHQAVLPEPATPPAAFTPTLASAAAAESDAGVSPLEALVARLPDSAAAAQQRAGKSGGPAAAGALAGDRSNVPRHERWEFQFPPGNTIDTYSRQMDYFKIELGIVGGSDDIVYLANLTDAQPAKRTGKASDEKRLYLVWQRGAMREADEELARRSQVPVEGRIMAHFCPEAVETQLAQLEDGYASQKGITQIRKTTFGIQANDFGGFRFYVIDQKADQT